MEERSFFIIKPDGLMYKDEILKMISSKVFIYKICNIKITKGMIRELYPKADELEMKIRIKEYNLENQEYSDVIFGIVEGKNSTRKTLLISGEKTNPQECEKETIRYKFGGKAINFNGIMIQQNAIHRPINRAEAMEGLRFFYLQF